MRFPVTASSVAASPRRRPTRSSPRDCLHRAAPGTPEGAARPSPLREGLKDLHDAPLVEAALLADRREQHQAHDTRPAEMEAARGQWSSSPPPSCPDNASSRSCGQSLSRPVKRKREPTRLGAKCSLRRRLIVIPRPWRSLRSRPPQSLQRGFEARERPVATGCRDSLRGFSWPDPESRRNPQGVRTRATPASSKIFYGGGRAGRRTRLRGKSLLTGFGRICSGA
jgi:hypothetical protein